MKKLLSISLGVLFMLCLLPSESLFAQVGLKGGYTFPNLSVSGEDVMTLDWKSVSGPIIGAFFSLNVSQSFSIQPEIYYTRKGSKFEESILGTTIKDELKAYYLEIPVLAKIKLVTQSNVAPIVFVGPYAAFKLSAKEVMSAGGVTEEEDIEDMKSTDFGLVFGGGIEFNLGNMLLILDGRYSLGLTNINDPEEGEDISVKNKAFSVMIGIGF